MHSAFIKLFNTLYCNFERILIPFARDSKKLLMLTHENSALGALEERISELIEEERVLLQLKAKGYIDNMTFMEQDDKIIKELEIKRQQYNHINKQILSSNSPVSATRSWFQYLKKRTE